MKSHKCPKNDPAIYIQNEFEKCQKMKLLNERALLNGFNPVKRTNSQVCLKIISFGLLAFAWLLIECKMALKSFDIEIANKNPENPNVKLHAMYRSGNFTIHS